MARLIWQWLWFSVLIWGCWGVAAGVLYLGGLDSADQQNLSYSTWAAVICWLPGLVVLSWPEGSHPFARVGLVVIGTMTRMGLVLAFLLVAQRQRWVDDFLKLGCWVVGYYLLALAGETYLMTAKRVEQPLPRDGVK